LQQKHQHYQLPFARYLSVTQVGGAWLNATCSREPRFFAGTFVATFGTFGATVSLLKMSSRDQ
jgi:hypothetical protein